MDPIYESLSKKLKQAFTLYSILQHDISKILGKTTAIVASGEMVFLYLNTRNFVLREDNDFHRRALEIAVLLS